MEFQRATKIPCLTDDDGELAVFVDDPHPNDISQGSLGNCYFLSSLSCMAEKSNGERIKKMFITDNVNEHGLYALTMYKSGVELEIVLDDYIACKWSRPCFTTAKGNELWVALAEKAWAKIHGSFHRTKSGYAHETMRDLTGAPAKSYKVSKHEDMWDKLVNADKRDYMIAASCGNRDENLEKSAARELGLVTAHSYSLIRVAEVQKDDETVKLVQLRNPWGGTEWNGKWSDSSDMWTDELKEELNFTEEDDGAFWMDWEDVKHYFAFMQICKVCDDYKYSFEECPDTPEAICKVTIEESGEYTFSVTQKDDRLFSPDSGYEYSEVSIYILNATDGKITFLDAHCCSWGDRDTYLACPELEAGEYILGAIVQWKEKTKDKSFVFTCYGASEAIIEDMEDEEGYDKDTVFKAAAESIDE